uniref:Uncharacterized protein n=1 Tax=Monopterus albus TaxID=43700 RepID=A0A3Q3J368_MONAL
MERLDEWSFTSKSMDMKEDFYFDYGAEEITDYQDPGELLAALKQKEEEVILAAQLGNALLLENRQLKEQSDKLHEQYADKLEELEQGRHELQLKLERCQSQWESQVGDLEKDVRELSTEVERLTCALGKAERDKSRAELDHSEHLQRLREELNTVSPAQGDQAVVLVWVCKCNVTLAASHEQRLITPASSVSTVCMFMCVFNHLCVSVPPGVFQLAEAQQEAEAAQGRSQQLQAQVEELQEEVSLYEGRSRGDASLLSELENSVETVGMGVSKEEVLKQQDSSYGLAQSDRQIRNHTWIQIILVRLVCDRSYVDVMVEHPECETFLYVTVAEEVSSFVARKNLMEAELVRSKNDMMSLNNQLLEAIQRKLELSQELEAWQDDIQIIINQQLRSQQQSEEPQNRSASNSVSFFHRPGRASSTRTRHLSSSSTWSSDSNQNKIQSPWRDWLRRGKGAQYGK